MLLCYYCVLNSMLSFKEFLYKKYRFLYLPTHLQYVVHFMPSYRSKFPSGIIFLEPDDFFLYAYLFAYLEFPVIQVYC
jgi:hypothetical protein